MHPYMHAYRMGNIIKVTQVGGRGSKKDVEIDNEPLPTTLPWPSLPGSLYPSPWMRIDKSDAGTAFQGEKNAGKRRGREG